MLKHLYIKNYALFAETEVDFPSGFNILTGETGAGKSLLVGALGLIMGKRADTSVLFYSEDKCVVEAEFGDLPARALEKLKGMEEFDMEDGSLIIRREIRPNGKSRAFINDTPVSLQTLREVSNYLLDLHGQHQNQQLLSPDRQLELLDAFAGTGEQVEAFRQQRLRALALQKEIHQLQAREQQMREQMAYLQFQLKELDEARLQAEEEEQLEQEFNLLQHVEDVKEALGLAVDRLYEQDASIYSQLSEVLDALQKVAGVSKGLEAECMRLRESQDHLKEASFALQNMLDAVESDPERLAFIEERLALYHKLKLKYGKQSGAELVELKESLESQLEGISSLEEQLSQKQQEFEALNARLLQHGLSLEQARKQAAKPLEEKIASLLHEVGFQQARFEVAIDRNWQENGMLQLEGKNLQPLPSGLNKVYFLIQTNPGLPAGLLSQIASGGEISRVMLAIKAALADKSEFPVLIFDEIDAGISGEIANKVGLVMKKLAQRFQIISITHLPQIAAKGDQHFEVYKHIEGENTFSYVKELEGEARIQSLAAMLSGDQPTEGALRNARELMGQSPI